MLHESLVSGAGATILIPIDRYLQGFSTTHLVIPSYAICISSCLFLTSVFSALQKTTSIPLHLTPTSHRRASIFKWTWSPWPPVLVIPAQQLQYTRRATP